MDYDKSTYVVIFRRGHMHISYGLNKLSEYIKNIDLELVECIQRVVEN